MYLNKALIIGNLTRDPELKSLPSGMQVTSFSLATNRVWKDKNGAKQESTDFHNIVVFGRQAETAAQYLKRGQSVCVEGRIQTRSWDGQDGKKQYRTEIVADNVQFGPKAVGGGAGGYGESSGGGQGNAAPAAPASKQSAPSGDEGIAYPDDEINPEDIPF
jgi:single-strand DNA-binding protein